MRRSAALAILVALVATSCSRGPATAPAPPDGIRVGGEATVALPRPLSVDPGNILDRSGGIVARTMCDPLLDVDRVTGEIVPALVESWVVTDGGTRIVMRLREGLTFWDGTPVTARDAVFGLSRAASADFAGEQAGMLAGIQGFAYLRGLEEAPEPRHRTEFSGMRVMSDVAFEMNLDFGAQVVLPMLTHPISSPLSRDAALADPEGFAARPMCVGPYRPTEPFDKDGATFTLERVATYAGVNDAYTGGGQGYLDTITFRWQPTVEAGAAGAGTAPVVAPARHDATDITDLDPLAFTQAAADPTREIVTTASPYVQYIGVPGDALPPEAMAALSMALDRSRLSQLSLRGTARPATAFLPSVLGTRLHRPEACSNLPARADVAAARALLEGAGVNLRGVRLTVTTNDDFGNAAFVQAVVQQWRTAFPGFSPQIQVTDWQTHRDALQSPDGFDSAFRMSWHAANPSPDSWLRNFSSFAIGNRNPVGYSDARVDRILNLETSRAVDPVDQVPLYWEVEDILCKELPMIPVIEDQRRFAVDRSLASATGELAGLADPITGGLLLRELHRP